MEQIKIFFDSLGAGLGAFLGAIFGALISFIANYFIQERKLTHEKNMYKIQNLSKDNAKEILFDALSHQTHSERSFETLQNRLGLEQEKVREMLLELRAKRSVRPEDGREYWYLIEREEEVFKKRAAKTEAKKKG